MIPIPRISGYTYDAAGNMSNDSFHAYTFDAEGNIIAVDSGQTATYVYNALNQRVQTVVGSATTGYVFNAGGQRVSEWSWNGTACDVTVLLRGYSEKVDQFYAWLLAEVEARLPLEVEDYRACRKAIRRQHGRLSYEVMIGLWAQAGADPYQHLPKHLTMEQLEDLKTLPHRSPQQVDYIIACMDKDGICDDHLRDVVHKFFNGSLVDGATD